ncbi:MAG: NAD-dependent epimerase/dehydratase family protein [Deltaproteobacteria bacterium]|nr:NAD-dependent epimerase/dehydratase family protein [Deltaproteobacteria bacterium]
MRHPIIQEDLAYITSADLPWESLAGKTVLITGANGFLPAYMVETLLYLNEQRRLDIRILALVRSIAKAELRFGGDTAAKNLIYIEQDVCRPILPPHPAQVIIHAASLASPKFYGLDPVGTLTPNVIGTYNLLEYARQNGSDGFLFFSSGEVYGEVRAEQIPTAETDYGYVDPMQVRSCYAESKRLGETMCVSWNRQYGVPTKVVRPFHTYGPGMSLTDGRVFADFVADVVARRDIFLKSTGSARRSFCYLADAVAGFFTVLFKGENAQAYNVSNDDGEISVKDLAVLVAGLFPELGLKVISQPESRPAGYLESQISRNKADTSKIKALGWEPRVSLQEGFTRTIESYL